MMECEELMLEEDAGGSIANGLCRDNKEQIRRRWPRTPVQMRALLYRAGRFQTTTIVDLSSGGAGLHGAVGIAPGDVIRIELLNGRCLDGEVRWWLAGRCGVSFPEPLPPDDGLLTSSNREATAATAPAPAAR